MATSNEQIEISQKMRPYEHDKLDQPDKQIRLLQRVKDDAQDLHTFEMSNHHLDEIPRFIAISYTWGALHPESTVQIGSAYMNVRQNCLEALNQAASYAPAAYIWIDSICINQSDEEEKSSQVAMMATIYKRAATVLACVGTTADDSDWLFAMSDVWLVLEQYFPRPYVLLNRSGQEFRAHDPNHARTSRLWEVFATMLHESTAWRLLAAYRGFERRPYWSRLWIAQELFVNDNVTVVCGGSKTRLRGLVLLKNLAIDALERDKRFRSERRGHAWTQLSTMDRVMGSKVQNMFVQPPSYTLAQTFLDFEQAQCSDLRDHLFGVLAMVDWSGRDLTPVRPDYSKTTLEVALEIAPKVHSSVTRVLSILHINCLTSELQSAVHQRIEMQTCGHEEHLKLGQLPAFSRMPPKESLHWTELGLYHDGRLVADLVFDADRKIDDIQAVLRLYETRSKSSDEGARLLQDHPPKEIYVGNTLAALACSSTRPGDLIGHGIYRHSLRTPHQALIFRSKPESPELYDVIGQAILVNGHRVNVAMSRQAKLNRTSPVIRIEHSAEDALLLCGQDVVSFDPWEVDPMKQLLRLVTLPIARPTGAGRMMVQSEHDKAHYRRTYRQAEAEQHRTARYLEGLKPIFGQTTGR